MGPAQSILEENDTIAVEPISRINRSTVFQFPASTFQIGKEITEKLKHNDPFQMQSLIGCKTFHDGF